MEQYLLQLPKRLAQEVRAAIAAGESADVEMISGGALRWLRCWLLWVHAIAKALLVVVDTQPTTSTLRSW